MAPAFRIGVAPETAPVGWHDFFKKSGVSRKTFQNLYKAGVKAKAKPTEWFVSFDPVPAIKWLAVERFSEDRWIPEE